VNREPGVGRSEDAAAADQRHTHRVSTLRKTKRTIQNRAPPTADFKVESGESVAISLRGGSDGRRSFIPRGIRGRRWHIRYKQASSGNRCCCSSTGSAARRPGIEDCAGPVAAPRPCQSRS
jgi:hypothetical protein